MPFNAIGQYSATHKVWDHVGRIIPDVEHSEGMRPHLERGRPAPWLPVQFFDRHFENWNVIMPGKIVGFDNSGDLVPAQYGLAGASVTYGTDDVDAGVTDVRTGAALLAADTGTFTVASVADFMALGVAMAVSGPVGVCPQAYLQWAGGDGFNPADLRQHNYNMQHKVSLVCDYVLELPVVPATATSEALTFGAPNALNRSASTALSNLPVARNTTRTPFTFAGGSSATLFVNEVSAVASVLRAGEWHVNLTTGVITVYATAAPAAVTLTYRHYAAAPASVSRFACAVGDLRRGDFLVADVNSNWAEAAAGDNFRTIMGQIIDVVAYPRSGLDRVRTAYNPAIATSGTGALPGTAGQLDQMAGSATGGVPASVHYAGASDTTVLINLISR